jgi:hypothetical protein
MLVWLFGGWLSLRQKQNLTGDYFQEWTVDHPNNDRELPLNSSSDATIRHFSTRLTGRFTFDGHEFRIRGKVDKDFINGEWFDMREGSTYHGVFQFRIEIHPYHLNGRWIGFSNSRVIRSGHWIWTPKNKSS